MITANIPFRALENPYLAEFFRAIRPTYKAPSRKQFINLLNAEYERVKLTVEEAINKSDFIALSADGWTDISRNRLINVIVHVPKPMLYATVDATLERHTAEHIRDIISEQIDKIGARKITAFITDNAANMKAAWGLLEKKFPWIVFEGCKAHSVDLAAKDFVKHPNVDPFVKKCTSIAKFFR